MTQAVSPPSLPPGGWRQWAGVAVALAVATALLHGRAVDGGWLYDDAPQLRFAVAHAPWQYFFVPEVMRQQSYAHITPFNSLFYDIGLSLFGLRAAGHYVHMLGVLWLAALATWFLLRPWIGAGLALGGALLWLAMPPTGVVAQLLMTGHYAYGLLFSVLALAAFARAVRSDSVRWALVAAGCYALACLCKELYVPLLLVFAAWPGLPWRQRLRLGAALVVVGVAYTVWRLHVLGGVGGYAALAGGATTLQLDPASLLSGLHALQADVFGRGVSGWFALALAFAAVAVLAAGSSGRRPSARFLMVCGTALLAPVLPLLLFNVPYGLGRVAILIGWGVAVLVVWQLARIRLQGRRAAFAQVALSAALIGLLAFGQRHAMDGAVTDQLAMTAANDFLIHADPDETLVAEGLGSVDYLLAMRDAVRAVEGRMAPRVVADDDALAALDPTRGAASWAWHPACNCLRRLGDAHAQRVAAIRAGWAAGTALTLAVQARVDSAGRVKTFRWHFDGSAGQHRVEVRDMLRLDLARSGVISFGLDSTFDPPEPALLRFSVTSADGGVRRSPWLALSLSKTGALNWRSSDALAPVR